MKHLNRVLLINWLHYTKELVNMKTINFFTGSNGAGKSAFIDAIQVVLLGETYRGNFNQAANSRSDRTLEGYLTAQRGDNSPKSRKGKDFSSYIVCEFYDDVKKDHFVLGAMFECTQNGDISNRFFSYTGEIPPHCYMEQQVAMDIDHLKLFLKQTGDTEYFFNKNPGKYKTFLSTRINIHDQKYFSLIKKSIALKQEVKLEEFITENICDVPDRPDIVTMQENICHYKEQEKLALYEEEKLEVLTSICKVFNDLQSTKQEIQMQEFLVLWGEKEHLVLERQQLETTLEETKVQSQSLNEEIQALTTLHKDKEHVLDQLKYKRDNDDAVKEKRRLEEQLDSLYKQENRLSNVLFREQSALTKETHEILSFCSTIATESILFPSLQTMALELKKLYQPFLNRTGEVFLNPEPFMLLVEKTTVFSAELQERALDVRNQLDSLQGQLDEKQHSIALLKKNIKHYPSGLVQLKERLKEALTATGEPCEVEILADVLEITKGEEDWRQVVEAYLNTQKFYLLISPSHYSQALALFHQWKKEFKDNSFGLVDVSKLREREQVTVKQGSLSEKVQTTHSLGKDYINYLLGRVMCCQTPEESRGYAIAVTASGTVYQGYVLRNYPKHLLESAYIGKKAVEIQLEKITRERDDLLREKTSLESSAIPFRAVARRSWLLTQHYLQSNLPELGIQYQELLENQGQQQKTQQLIGQCNLLWLQELELQIKDLSKELQQLMQRRDGLMIKTGEYGTIINQLIQEKIPEKIRAYQEKESQLSVTIGEEFKDTVGLPCYLQEFERLGSAKQIVTKFQNKLQRQRNSAEKQQSEVFSLRQNYNQRFQPCSFQVDSEHNEEYQRERDILADSKLPAYKEKIQEARYSAMEQFENEFLDKLKSGIDQVKRQVKTLNKALQGTQFGSESYEFKIAPHPDYREYYNMIMSEKRMVGDVGFFRSEFDAEFGSLREELFSRLASSDEELNQKKASELERNIETYTNFRTYLKFDMESTDKNGVKQLLSKVLTTNSGGETQTPFYVAMLASYAQLYKVNDQDSKGNTLRLVIFDEAFSKMDSDRIIECVRLLRRLKLQAIMSTPPEKVADIMPEVDQTLLFSHRKFHMTTQSFSREQLEAWQEKGDLWD